MEREEGMKREGEEKEAQKLIETLRNCINKRR